MSRALAMYRLARVEWLPVLLSVLLWIEVAGFWVPAEQGSRGTALLIGTSMAAVLMARRGAPLATAALVAAWMSLWVLAGPPAGSLAPWLACLVAIFAVAQEASWVRSIAGAGLVLASNWLQTLIATNDFADYAFVTVFGAGAFAAGRAVQSRQLRARQAEDEVARLAKETDRVAAAAAAEERRRIARELHDVVSHSMGVIVVQAQAAAGMLDGDAVPARRAVESIERTGREALGEMRRMLALMRDDDHDGHVDPLPSLRQLQRLVADMRAAGVPVTLAIQGHQRALPAGVDASAYRILQEGLTNVIKHTSGARAEVVVAYLPDAIELSVRDHGRDAKTARRGGHGLVGIRERVAIFNGTVEAGPLADGGWRIRARLPVPGGSA